MDEIKKSPHYWGAFALFCVTLTPYYYGFMSWLSTSTDPRLRGNMVVAGLLALTAAALPLIPFDLWARWRRRKKQAR